MERKTVVFYAILSGLLLLASTSTILYKPAYALVTISGRVTYPDGGTSMPYARVSAEASGGHYFSTTADAYGVWSMSVDSGVTYTVDASKDTMYRNRLTGIVGPASNLLLKIGSQTTNTIEFFIVADEEFRSLYGSSWQTTAKNKLFTAQPYFAGEHNIHFKDQYYYTTWNSINTHGTCTMKDDVKVDTGWNTGNRQGANVLWLVSGQHINGEPTGCADIPSGPPSGNNYPASIVLDFSYDMSEDIMHEIGHNYGLNHGFDTWYDIMNYVGYVNKNWKPSNDDLMQARRGWY